MLAYNEKSAVEVEATFLDAFGRPTSPATVHWRLNCETTGKVLQDWTAASVSTDAETGRARYYLELEIPGALNAMQNPRSTRETKALIIVANKDAAGEFSQDYRYMVRNLPGRS